MNLSGRRIAILATNGVDAIELGVVRKRLQKEGASTVLISLTSDPITTWSNKKWQEQVSVDSAIENVDVQDFDAVFLPGGLLNSDKLRTSKRIIDFLAQSSNANKPIAAICHAPWLLIDSNIAKGKKVTSYPSLQKDLENAGATWIDEQVVRDGNIITSRRPDDVEAFAREVVKLFSEK